MKPFLSCRPARALALLTCVGLAACGSIPKRTFVFDAVDIAEQPRPCLIVIDDDWQGAAERNQVVNVTGNDELPLTIEFRSSEVEITAAPLMVDGTNVPRMPRSRKEAREFSSFMDETRRLRVRDPQKQLFILPRAGVGG